jgi:hypothetical protein
LFGGGLIFAPGRKLFLVAEGTDGKLRTIDKTTGLPVGSVTLNGYTGKPDQSIAALANNGGDFLYGVTRKEGNLIRINPTSGKIAALGPAGDSEAAIDALAFDHLCSTSTAPALGVPALVLLLLTFLLIGIRRRHTGATH